MDWKKKYDEIAEKLDIDRNDDREVTLILNRFIEKQDINIDKLIHRLDRLINNKSVIVFGAGPSLRKGVLFVKENKLHSKHTFIAADGSITALLEEEILPDILVTDLDGRLRDILRANLMGSLTIVHAHGDNINILKRTLPKLRNVIGTTQIEPIGRLQNFGGFTDGDRCVFLAVNFKAKEILLSGMDFGNKIGRYSYRYNKKKKLQKLEIGKKLIEELKKETDIPIKNLC